MARKDGNGLGEEMGVDVLEVEREGGVSWLGFHLLMNKELIVNFYNIKVSK